MAALAQFIRRPTRRQVVIGVLVLVVVLAASVFWATRSSAAPIPRLATAATGTVRQTVAASGTVAAAQEADLSFAASGQVTGVTATVGQQVAAGQALATIDSAALPSQLAQAQASLASDQARVAADASASSTQRGADAAAVSAAQAQVAVAQQSLAKATLTSPIAGTVAAVNLTVGQQVSAGGSGGSSGGGSGGAASASTSTSSSSTASASSSAQVVVLSTNSYVVNATVDDTQVGSVKPGLQAQIVPNGATAPVFGLVSSVAMVGSTSAGVASYPVVITVTGTPSGLHVGASAQVSIITKQLSDVLVVPSAAVRQQGGAASVQTWENGRQASVPVTVGLSSGGETQIVSGIAEGTQVVLPTAPAGASTGTTTRTGGGLGGGGTGFGGGGFGGGTGGGGTGRTGGAARTGGAGGAG